MSDDKKAATSAPPAPKRITVMLLRDGVHGEADADGRTRKHVMGDLVEFDAETAERLIDAGVAKMPKAKP